MIHEQARIGFGRGADSYERGRPSYPREAIEWLGDRLGLRPGQMVLDVGAGTGKLTTQLVATGATVLAVEPVAEMRAVLERVAPPAIVLDGTAEALPAADATVDAIAVASAFHWFDGPAALTEFHRALRPEGRLALIFNRRRREEPLNAAISEIIEPYRRGAPSHYGGGWRAGFDRTELFTAEDELYVPFEQRLDADGLVDRVHRSASWLPRRMPSAKRCSRESADWPACSRRPWCSGM